MARFAANLGMLWPDRELPARIAAAARAGFEAIELHWPYDHAPEAIAAACNAHGVRLLGTNTPRGDVAAGEFGLAALPGREAAFEAGLDAAVDWCRAAGGSAIHCLAGVVPAAGQAAARRCFLRNLAVAADRAGRHGLTVLIEPLNPHDVPGYFLSTLDAAAGLLAELDDGRVRLQFDAYHVGRVEGRVVECLERSLPLTGHVQIAAVPSRAEPDEGEVDYAGFLAALDRLGYGGWVGCEYRPRGDTDAGLAWVERLGVRLGRRRSFPSGDPLLP